MLVLAFGVSPSPAGLAQNNDATNNTASNNNYSTNSYSLNNSPNQNNENAQANNSNANVNNETRENSAKKTTDEFFDDGSEEDSVESSLTIDSGDGPLAHPVAPSKWRTQELMLRASLPNYEKLQACQTEVRALGAKAINRELLLESRNILAQAVNRNKVIYHWCFYLTAMQLDNQIDKLDVKVSFLDKYKLFIKEMKGLWILARALDATFGSKRYFGYIRSRYIDMTRDYFGRDLTVISAPLGDAKRRMLPPPPKAAGTDFSDY